MDIATATFATQTIATATEIISSGTSDPVDEMTLSTFISCLSIVSAFLGTIFFVKGFLKITPDAIATQSRTMVDYNYAFMKDICAQKSSIICGFLLVLIATIIQFAGLFVDESVCFNQSKHILVIIVVGVVIILFLCFTIIDKKYTAYTLDKAKKAMCSKEFKDYIRNNRIRDNQFKDIEEKAKYYFGLLRSENENNYDFLTRVYKVAGVDLPETVQVDNKDKP